MPEELDKLRIALQQAASERGLIVFDGEPDVAKLASVAWNGDWLSFLDLAQLRRYADWIFECREAIDTVLDETEQIGQENRTLRSQEAARKLHEYAMQLAHHPRFP